MDARQTTEMTVRRLTQKETIPPASTVWLLATFLVGVLVFTSTPARAFQLLGIQWPGSHPRDLLPKS